MLFEPPNGLYWCFQFCTTLSSHRLTILTLRKVFLLLDTQQVMEWSRHLIAPLKFFVHCAQLPFLERNMRFFSSGSNLTNLFYLSIKTLSLFSILKERNQKSKLFGFHSYDLFLKGKFRIKSSLVWFMFHIDLDIVSFVIFTHSCVRKTIIIQFC